MFTPLTVCFVVSVWVGGSLCQPEPDTVYNTIAFYGATKFLEYTARLPELDTRLKDASGESHPRLPCPPPTDSFMSRFV